MTVIVLLEYADREEGFMWKIKQIFDGDFGIVERDSYLTGRLS